MVAAMSHVHFTPDPHDTDFDAAFNVLSLVLDADAAQRHVMRLRNAAIDHRRANDIVRMTGDQALGEHDHRVAKNLAKIHDGDEIRPILLVRDPNATRVIVADGWHRLCAVLHADPEAVVLVRLV